MFEEVTKREGGKRAARRSAWVAGSTAVQAGVVAAIILISAAVAQREAEAPLVDVKLVKAAAPRPPSPPPPPPAPRRKQTVKPKTDVKPRAAMVQPKEMPDELKPPEPPPAEPEDEGGEGDENGVIGGVAGGVVGGTPAPPPPPKAAPVHVSTPPVAVASPSIQYTQQALEHEIEGTLVVECVIDVDGTVHDCRVLKSLPFMDSAVVSALQHARYRPYLVNGQAVPVTYTWTIRLKLPQ